MKDVFIVIPSYNEAKVIRTTLQPLLTMGYSIVVVDDCSTDNTLQQLQGTGVYYIKHPINLGAGAAYQTGMEFALQQGAKYIVHFDADGQHPHNEIENLLKPLQNGEADVAFGSRFKRKEDTDAIPPLRKIVLKGARIVNGIFTGVWTTDAHNGFRGFTAQAAAQIKMRENRMAHASELLSIIKENKFRLVEIPIHVVYTEYSMHKGQKNLNSINILIDLILNRLFR